ncbi:MAG: GGDEF domain-containing protein, partial [Calditrichaeota bacterium]
MNTSTLKTTIRVWLVIMVAGGFLPLRGENGPVRFERIGFAQGLPQSYITVILQDRQGFLWVGTADGLARYDGYSFITYRYDPLDTTSISDNYIQGIYEDRQGFLWVTTSGGGINRMDPHTGRFVHFRRRRSAPYRLHDNTVTAVVEDRAGNLWIGTAGGLHLVGPDRTYSRLFLPHTGNPGGLRDGHITVLYPDREGNLWIGTRRGGLH